MKSLPFLLLLGLAGCQCVEVPERRYACAADDVTCEVELDAGTPDASVACDGGACRFADAGVCETWACVDSLWGAAGGTASASLGARETPVPDDIDGGQYGWYGGVLLPDGRVLAVAHHADRFLTFDPRTYEVASLGPILPGTQRKYAGAVLAPNGRVYAFPYEAHQLLEIDLAAGTLTSVGPVLGTSDGGAPKYVGGVVDGAGRVWTVSEAHESMPVLRYDPATGQAERFAPGDDLPWGGWWGMARLPDDRLLAFPKEYDWAPKRLSPHLLVIAPGALPAPTFEVVPGFDVSVDGFSLQGGSLTRDGSVCATPAGAAPTGAMSRWACVSPALRVTVFLADVQSFGFNAAFGDGTVWTTPDSNNQLLSLGSGGTAQQRTIPGQRYGYLGLVASPQGLVGIPGGKPAKFLLLQPGQDLGSGVFDRRPLPVLLSPYFNKL